MSTFHALYYSSAFVQSYFFEERKTHSNVKYPGEPRSENQKQENLLMPTLFEIEISVLHDGCAVLNYQQTKVAKCRAYGYVVDLIIYV